MRTSKLSPWQPLIFLIGFTLAFDGCETVTIQNRTACFVNGQISLGSTCANTVGAQTTEQLTTEQSLDVLESRPAASPLPAHPPAVYQSAEDYGEETVELETACRLLGKKCSYELQSTIQNHREILRMIKTLAR